MERDNPQQNIRRLAELIRDIRFAMLTTIGIDGTLHSRPMATQEVEFDGDLWFFTENTSPKVTELRHNPHINVSMMNPDNNCYVSLTGQGEIVYDHKKMEELWSPAYKAWFPQGLNDPELALIRVRAERAEYWDAPSSKLVQAFGFVKALVTGEKAHPGEHERVNL